MKEIELKNRTTKPLREASKALILCALVLPLAACGTSQPASVSGLGKAIATDSQSACGLSREDQAKIDTTNESLISSGAHGRPEKSFADICQKRRDSERRKPEKEKPAPAT